MSFLRKYPVLDGKVFVYLSPQETSVYTYDYKGIPIRKRKIILDNAAEKLILNFNGKETSQRTVQLFPSAMTQFSKLEAPDELTCNTCNYFSYCYHCILRGLIKAKEIGKDNCRWANKNIIIINKINLTGKWEKEKVRK